MKKFFKILGIIILVLIAGGVIAWFGFLKPEPPPISDEDRAQITLMPLPLELELGSGTFKINSDLGYSVTGVADPKIEKALDRFYSRLGDISAKEIEKKERCSTTNRLQEC